MKKGFTLVELIISITLVGIILISMIGTLIRLKASYNIINEDVEARTYSALVSKVINEHFMKNNGVKSVTCSRTLCNITLGNNKKMKLELLTMDKTYEYVRNSNGQPTAQRTAQITTLRYSEVDGTYSYLKTISQIVTDYLDPETGEATGGKSTQGYKFMSLSKSSFEYPSVVDSSLKDLFFRITVEMSDAKYNINLYSTSSVDADTSATLYTLTYDNNGGSGCTIKRIKDGVVLGTLCTPTRTNWTFDGWWTNLSNGTQVTATTIATSDKTIYAKWKPTNIQITAANALIAKLGSRNYYKKYAGSAYVGYYYTSLENTGPILVGTTADSVAFYSDDDTSKIYTYEQIINYKGTNYYVSSTEGFMDGNLDNTSTTGIIKLIDQATSLDNARELLNLANL